MLKDRFRGCLLGLAIGDALGTTLEFKAPGSFEPIHDMVGGGPFNLAPGEWTDDTSMALCLAESLVSCQGMDLADQMQRYLHWYREGYLSSTGFCFDIGNTVRSALERFDRTGDPVSGSTDPYSAGNGSIMRLAPVAMYFVHDNQASIRNCAKSSLTTHGTRMAVDACRYFGSLISGALRGVSKDTLLSEHFFKDNEQLVREIDEIARGSFKEKEPPDIQGTGYVVKSLEAALWAFFRSESFESGCLLAVNLGNDADTTGAVYGQIAGAYYGESGLPVKWREQIILKDLIRSFADQIYIIADKAD